MEVPPHAWHVEVVPPHACGIDDRPLDAQMSLRRVRASFDDDRLNRLPHGQEPRRRARASFDDGRALHVPTSLHRVRAAFDDGSLLSAQALLRRARSRYLRAYCGDGHTHASSMHRRFNAGKME